MITLWDGWRTFQKRGKVRITCYKVHKGTTVSGSHCPLSKSGIRVDTYFTDCGAACNSDQCTVSNKDCSTLNKKAATEFEKYETNELFGAVLPVKGANTLDWNGMKKGLRRHAGLAGHPPEGAGLLSRLAASRPNPVSSRGSCEVCATVTDASACEAPSPRSGGYARVSR